MAFYDGRPLWEENFEPLKTNGTYEVITQKRAVFVVNGAITHTPTAGAMFGVALEQDGKSAASQSLGLIGAALAGHNAPMNGSRLEVAVRLAGTTRVECAAPVARGQYLKVDSTGKVLPATDPTKWCFRALEDGAIGSLTLVNFDGMRPAVI